MGELYHLEAMAGRMQQKLYVLRTFPEFLNFCLAVQV
jgi:hypothetical protein